MAKALDSGSDVRGFKRFTDDLFLFFSFFLFSVPDIFVLIIMFMICFHPNILLNRMIDFIYIFYNRKSAGVEY